MSKHIVMSPPDYFDIEYSINPWMDTANRVDHIQAGQEWNTLKDTYERLGCQVSLIPPVKGLPDLVFTTDHVKWINGTLFASNFRYPERVREQEAALPWYTAQDIPVTTLPPGHYMEGGDVYHHAGKIFVGYGYRTSKNTARFLAKKTGLPTLALQLIDDKFYHLDTCFFPLDDTTAFYYPPAYSPEARLLLQGAFSNLIELTEDEAGNFVCNSVRIGQNVLCQADPVFEKRLTDLGYTPIVLSAGQFNKSGGGIHCLSQIME